MGLARNMGLARLPHGGDLAAARRRFPDAPEPLIDLSTGINPHPYPLPPLPPDLFTRLPEPEALERLAATAARAYGAAADQVVVGARHAEPAGAGVCARARRAAPRSSARPMRSMRASPPSSATGSRR